MAVKKEEIILSRKAFLSVGLPSIKSQYGEGANLTVEVFLRGTIDPATDLVVNLTDVETVLAAMRTEFDHKHMQFDFPQFSPGPGHTLTYADVAQILWKWLEPRMKFPNCSFERLQVRFGEFESVEVNRV